MHGRVKVRTSEEEKVRKEKQRQEKLKIFRAVMHKINEKRNAKEFDKQLLELTGQVLSANPDISTLWNIRRDILIILRNTEEDETIGNLYDSELSLTEHCLKYNPKSYSAWHQRVWVLSTRKDPNWKKELNLCDMYLNFDDRNFHTWNYRRYVVSQCNASLEDEFKFTTNKLHDNFSNYSAWHYRSKILIELYPDLEGGRPIEASHHKKELELVQNAAFTDPDDTSAWFYQRWLLSAVRTTTQVVVCRFTPEKCTVALNKQVSFEDMSTKTVVYFNNEPVQCEWASCTGNQCDVLWLCKPDRVIQDGLDIKIEFNNNSEHKQILKFVKKPDHLVYLGKSAICFQNKYAQPVTEELKKQLVSCRQLLQLEPDNKWTLLTATIILHCIDAKEHHKESIDNLNALKSIDKLRKGYYDDLITKWNMEYFLTKIYGDNSLIDAIRITFDDKMSCVPHAQYLSHCEKLDLSNQQLTSRVLPSLIMLQHCKKLYLANNTLTTVKTLPVLNLETIDITGNNVDKTEVEDFLKNKHIYHHGNFTVPETA